MKTFVIALVATLALGGCTDAEWGKLTSLGNAAEIKCYSGTELIYDGQSTGKIVSEANSDGYFFTDAKTGMNVEVSGNCVIRYLP